MKSNAWVNNRNQALAAILLSTVASSGFAGLFNNDPQGTCSLQLKNNSFQATQDKCTSVNTAGILLGFSASWAAPATATAPLDAAVKSTPTQPVKGTCSLTLKNPTFQSTEGFCTKFGTDWSEILTASWTAPPAKAAELKLEGN